jgi:decaprenylphospho-beta-D-erythro-pentofuranosid-2-ulose 2-reductase
MDIFPNEPGYSPRILLLGGTSEIGLAILSALAAPAQTQVILAGRDEQRLAAAGKQLSYQVRTVPYDAIETVRHQAFADAVFAEGPLDMVISAAGILVPQEEVERDVRRAAEMIETNFTGHVTSLLAIAGRMRACPRSRRSARARPTSSTARPRPGSIPLPAGWRTRCTAPGSA